MRDPAPCAGHAVAATDNSWWSYPAATASTVRYTANILDQYAVGAVTPTYDGNGNLTFDLTFTYGYDAESRLTSGTEGGTTVATRAQFRHRRHHQDRVPALRRKPVGLRHLPLHRRPD